MKRLFNAGTLLVFLLSLSVPAFSQGFFANVTGTVSDGSGALIPGVSVKATAVDTAVVTTTLSNEAGAYAFGNLLPGKYTLSASLPGFQTKTLTDLELSQNTSYRYNFELAVAGVNTQVEVSVSVGMILATQGASVGQVLSQQKVQDLPFVGNNVLDLITVMAGVENIVPTNPPSAANAFGRENTTFAGVRADNISIVRDGIQMQDNRNPNGIYSVTTINPDLVGEIRLILAPVDVELGRGNGTIQYSTRSGTNRYAGSAVWSFRNTALDPNTWTNNRNQNVTPGSPPGTVPVATQRDWSNTHQVTVSYGGPIIRNKTFFFALFDLNEVKQRVSTNFTVLTPCARLGIFRYFNNWNNEDVNFGADGTGTTAARVSVNLDGSPKPPTGPPSGVTVPGTYDPSLQFVSVFGPLSSKPTQNDCSDAPINKTTLVPNGVTPGGTPGAGGGYNVDRKQLDPSGYISRAMAFYPTPNNYETGDGLNTAGFRWLRHFTGLDNLFGSGEATGKRRQYNVKIDHNFTSNHKANFNVSYERVDSDDVVAALPGMFSNKNFRRPMVLSGGFTSTLSPTMLNEARFGMRRQGINVVAPWDQEELADELGAFFPADVNGFRIIPTFTSLGLCNPHTGARPPGGCLGLTITSIENSPTTTFSDTVSWTKGAHSLRFNGELRLNASAVKGTAGGGNTHVTVTAGNVTGTAPGSTGPNDLASSNPALRGLVNNAAQGQTSAGANARTLMSYLAGSVSNAQTLYFLNDPNNTTQWTDGRTQKFLFTELVQREFSTWAKDEWKVSRNLTITPGIRWDYFGVPFVKSGLTVAPVGGGSAAFGVSGRDFTGWMKPGVRADVTAVEFVGPKSPNPDRTTYPNDYTNFGPSLAFAWSVPWFGEGRTTVRGGYQITYQGGGRFITLQPILASPPGSTLNAGFNTQNVYLDMTRLATAIPPVQTVQPLEPIQTTGPRSANFTTFDPGYKNPYVQNLTLSITRTVSRNFTVDARYIGTLSRSNYSTLALNTNNFLYNGLLDALTRVRSGTEITKAAGDPLSLLDQIFRGVNLCTSTNNSTIGNCGSLPSGQSYGPIGTTTGAGANALYQTAAMQMRASDTFQEDLADALFDDVAGTITNFNWSPTGTNAATLPPIPSGQVGAALRLNGFPDNFIRTNPQFGNTTLQNNHGYSNYHSLQFQVSTRPIQGFSGSATYNWSKNLGLGALANPVERAENYTYIGNNPGHSLRTNGTFELPIGPNKLFFGNSSGWVARALERWQLGLIYNLTSGAPQSITAESMLYGNGLPDVRHPVDFNKMRGVRWGIQGETFLEGRYFDNDDLFVKVDDPSCTNVTPLQGLAGECTLQALAMVVPAGTADSQVLGDGRTVQIVLQHPAPGKRGNLGNGAIIGLGSWRFDANLGKTFQISESKSVQVRFDAQNVLNHPQPANPNLSITNDDAFGRIASKSGTRLFQGQLRFSF